MAPKAPLQLHCVKCDVDVDVKLGKWECFPGEVHQVAERIYRIPSGIPDFGDRVQSRVRVFVSPERKWKDEHGNEHSESARAVEFARGMYATTNPEDIFFFETRYNGAFLSQEDWEKEYIHPRDLLAKNQREVDAQIRKLKEDNALLEEMKAYKAEKEAAAAKKAAKAS